MNKVTGAAVLVVLGVLAVGPVSAGAASPKLYRVSATLDPRQVVTVTNRPWPIPAAYAKARGTFTGTFDPANGRLTWTLKFSALERPKLRIVDIHYGPPGRFGAFLTRACAGCESGDHGVLKIKPSARKDIAAGQAWVTLITEDYPNGVIRGQIRARKSA